MAFAHSYQRRQKPKADFLPFKNKGKNGNFPNFPMPGKVPIVQTQRLVDADSAIG